MGTSRSSFELASSRTMVMVGPPSPVVPQTLANALPGRVEANPGRAGEAETSDSDIEGRFPIFADDTSNSECSHGPSSPVVKATGKTFIETTPQSVGSASAKDPERIIESDSEDSNSE